MQIRLVLAIICMSYSVFGQDIPIGSWQGFNLTTTANAVAVGNGKVYGGSLGLLEYDIATNTFETYNKVNGLSDASITRLAYNELNKSLIISYQNSNIDIFENGEFYNLPEIKNANIIASKKISNISCYEKDAYLATGLGIVVLNLEKKEVRATYPMVIAGAQAAVQEILFKGDSIFAFTNKGTFSAHAKQAFLEDISNWKSWGGETNISNATLFNNLIYATVDDKIIEWNYGQLSTIKYSAEFTVQDLEVVGVNLFAACFKLGGAIVKFNNALTPIDTIYGTAGLQLAHTENILWIGDQYFGVRSLDDQRNIRDYATPGIADAVIFDIRHIGDNTIAIHGGTDNGNALGNALGLSVLNNGDWRKINRFNGVKALDTMADLLDIIKDPQNDRYIATSYGSGLIEFNTDWSVHKVIKTDPPVGENTDVPNNYLATYLEVDKFSNLWMTVSNTKNNLMVRDRTGKWYPHSILLTNDYKVLGDMAIDNANHIWIVLPRANGLVVFSNNNTIDNPSDDQYKFYKFGSNSGNLASTNVLCVAKDKDGKIWVGTDDGISIINCPESAFSTVGCNAENKTVQFDQFAAGKLFQDESVKTICVDKANRKWVGTANGAWLLSEDAEKVLLRFTTANSPLPTNEITKISVDPITGLVYFGTPRGLVAYREGAIEAGDVKDDLITFPNPVPSSYSGYIAIKNLIDDADVRITDAAGQLVYRGKALGGQLVWDGKTYTGTRPQSGIYYIFASSADGGSRQKGQFAIIK